MEDDVSHGSRGRSRRCMGLPVGDAKSADGTADTAPPLNYPPRLVVLQGAKKALYIWSHWRRSPLKAGVKTLSTHWPGVMGHFLTLYSISAGCIAQAPFLDEVCTLHHQ